MKAERFNQIKKAAEVNAAFGDATKVGTIKKQVNYEALVDKIESWKNESVTNYVLSYYRPIFKALPRDIKGLAKKAFCDAIRQVVADNGTLFLLDDNGNVVPKRALAKVGKRGNEDLFKLLSNLLTSPTATSETTATATTESVSIDVLDPVTAEAVEWMLELA